jgi:hypothetical protein
MRFLLMFSYPFHILKPRIMSRMFSFLKSSSVAVFVIDDISVAFRANYESNPW